MFRALLAALSLALSFGASATPLRVGFIDSGLSESLPRFQPYLFRLDSRDLIDSANHGTGVVDHFLSKAESLGLTDVQVVATKLEDASLIVGAIEDLIQADVSVINMSLSFFMTDSRALKAYQDAIEKTGRDVLFVLSTGDERVELKKLKNHSTRLDADNVIVVGGVTELPQGPVIVTNYGSRVDLMGAIKPVEVLGAEGTRALRRGVSYLVPEVSAAAAILIARSGVTNPTSLAATLKSCARPKKSVGKPSQAIRLLTACP